MQTTVELAINRLTQLPIEEQERLALWLVSEIDDERMWQEKFQASLSVLEQMASEALLEHERGETLPFPGSDD